MSEAEILAARYVHGIFCEDVRDEVGGGASFIGVYDHGLRASEGLPGIVHKLAAVIWVGFSVNDEAPELEVALEVPGGTIVARTSLGRITPRNTEAGLAAIPFVTRQQARAVIRLKDITLPQAGRLRLLVTAWGKTWTAASLAIVAET